MAKLGASNINFTLNSVSIEDELNSTSLNVSQEVVNVRGFSSLAPEKVVDGYDWNHSVSGNADFADSQGDATLFAMLSSSAVAAAFDPTGTTAAADNPNYDGNVHLGSYSISGSTGGAITYSATLEGTGALTRAVS